MRRSGETSQWNDGKTHWALDLATICLFVNHFVLSRELNGPKELQASWSIAGSILLVQYDS